MKTKSFNEVIADYLKQRAAEDTLFAPKFTNPKKNIDECCRYILGEARKRGNEVVMDDSEVYGLAVHYYPKYIVIQIIQFTYIDIQLVNLSTCWIDF